MPKPKSKPDRRQRTGRYRLRAQIRGVVRWTCPDCGYVNRDRVRQDTFLVRCGNREAPANCDTLLVGPGIVFYRPNTGPKELPPDLIVPESGGLMEPLREATLDPEPWWSGEPIHQVKGE